MTDHDDLYKDLEAMGEATVRERLASNVFGPRKAPLVREWLAGRERSASEARDERDSSSARVANSLAREANLIASKALSRATTANVIAVIAIIVGIIAIFFSPS